jgi:hypothetical protein
MVVERVQSGFAIAPDFRVSRFDDRSARFAGFYGGWMFDRSLLIGGGGYWLTNGTSGDGMGYGGLVVQWADGADRNAGFGVRSLLGLGQATLTDDITYCAYCVGPPPRPFRGAVIVPTPSPTRIRYRYDVDFFVFEPQLNGFVNLGSHTRLTGGVGYRVIGDAHGFEDRLRGAVGSISVEFGSFGRDRRRP